ncbi:MAG TPA: aminotransferase class III-fold pyridoxal phosphate-dependent enzyme [Bacillota bacterium]|nr:aminotransferase class III-fold pyridoxal phosphate-dependent enzyme [Bacillota bacterium]
MDTEQIRAEDRRYVLHSWSVQGTADNLPIARADGCYFWDTDGNRYLDFSAQLVAVNTGHGRRQIIEAMTRQAEAVAYAAPTHAVEVRGTLARMVVERTPGPLHKVFFTLGGAEANENAIKLARLVTGRHKILSRYNSYHGATYGAISLTGDERRPPVEPGIPGVVHFLDPFCYRCPFGHTYPGCGMQCVDHLRQIIEYENPATVAAVIVEPIVGGNGVQVPPPEYLPALRRICDDYGILLICDEVMTGWGRTGAWFASERMGVVPDMITMAKGITSGYVPLGAVAVSERIANHFDERMLWLGLTYSGHPVACAAGIATIQVYEEEGLVARARDMEGPLLAGLRALGARHEIVGDVRGMGLFAAVDLVADRDARTPLHKARPQAIAALKRGLKQRGVYVYVRHNNLIISPPLTITEDQIGEAVEAIGGALGEAAAAR